MVSSWHSLLVRIGERCAEYGGNGDADDHIESCLASLVRDIDQYGEEILALLMQCVEELPHKAPLYGTLVGLINLENVDFVAKLASQSHDGLQGTSQKTRRSFSGSMAKIVSILDAIPTISDVYCTNCQACPCNGVPLLAALESENCNKIRTLMRFLTVLMCSKVIAPGSLIEVFETLVSSAATTIDEDVGNPSWQPRADFYVFCILASLPWGGLELAERVPDDLERVLAGVEAYLTLRKRCAEPSLSVFNVPGDQSQQVPEQEDFLEDLWSVVQGLMESGWKTESVPRPHITFESRLVTGPSHEFSPLSCPDAPRLPSNASDIMIGKHRQEAELLYPRRIGRLRIFPPSMTDEKIAPIDRFVVEEYLLDVLFFLNGCRRECAAYMVGLPVSFRYEYLMAETVFSQLLLLPTPPFRLMYYTVVMVDLCKALPGAFPGVVARAVRTLFERIGDMDVECRTRLVQWLAHHLSNFQFLWPWEEWAHVLDQPKWSPQRVFIQEILEKEIRLSYWDKIKESLQSSVKVVELLPPRSRPDYKFAPDYMGETSELERSVATELLGMIKGKSTAKDIQTYLVEKVSPNHGQKVAIDTSVQVFLHIGSKSFTHTVTVLERYGSVLSKLASSNQDGHVAIIEAVAEFWKYSAQMTAIVIDRMMGYRIVSNLAIVAWAFSDENVKQLHLSDQIWEILTNAINKTKNRTSDLQKDMVSIQKAAVVATAAVTRAQAKLDAAQLLLDAADTDEAKAQANAKNDWAKSLMRKAKSEESSSIENVEAKEALLSRALREQEALFLSVFQNFTRVLTDQLSNRFLSEGATNSLKGLDSAVDHMVVDGENQGSEADDKADDGERRNQRYGSAKNNATPGSDELKLEEEQQWRKCTLGQLRAISRHYATEVWSVMERLDTEVFTDKVNGVVTQTMYSGLRRPWQD